MISHLHDVLKREQIIRKTKNEIVELKEKTKAMTNYMHNRKI